MIVDSHCHLYDSAFDSDRDEVFNRAIMANVKKFVMVGCDKFSNQEVIKLQAKHKEVFATIGIHPSYADEVSDEYKIEFEELLKSNKIYAVGECGLDYIRGIESKEIQKNVFKWQLSLAKKYDLPVVIHGRDGHNALNDLYDILKEFNGLHYVLHAYSGSLEMAKRFIKIGAKFGIGGVITFKNALSLKEVVKNIDLKYLLLETDCPYLTPDPYRGKRNEPSYLNFIASEIARIKEVSVDEVIKVTTQNSNNLFKLER